MRIKYIKFVIILIKIILDKELTSKVIDITDINIINLKYLDIPNYAFKKRYIHLSCYPI